MCVVFYSAYTFPNRKVKSGVGELREGSLFQRLGVHMSFILVRHDTVDQGMISVLLFNSMRNKCECES